MHDDRDAAPKGPTESQQWITQGRSLIEQWTNLMATRAGQGEVLSGAEFETVRWMMAKVLWAVDELDKTGSAGLTVELREQAEVVLTQVGQKYPDDESVGRWVQDGGQGAG